MGPAFGNSQTYMNCYEQLNTNRYTFTLSACAFYVSIDIENKNLLTT